MGLCIPSMGQSPLYSKKPSSPSNKSPFLSSPISAKIPIDTAVHIGKLKNGFQFYIRKNPEPKNRVEFRLVVLAGSLQEEKNQLGAAHFLQHLAFSGTRHFPKMDLLRFFKHSGISPEPDLNTKTGFRRCNKT